MKRIKLSWLVFVIIFITPMSGQNIYPNVVSGEEIDGCGGLSIKEMLSGNIFASSVLIEKAKDEDTYAAWKIYDLDNTTAWSEGVDGDGVDEYVDILSVQEELVCGIEILPGMAKSEALFRMNNRPKKIELTFESSEGSSTEDSRYVIFTKEIYLEDQKKFQRFIFGKTIDEFKKEYDQNNNTKTKKYGSFRMKIIEVYKGTKYNDTCISEIRFLDKKGNTVDPFRNIR